MAAKTLSPIDYRQRRKKFLQQIGNRGVALLPSAPHVIRNHDVHFPYRQDSDFYYLTGFPEGNSIALFAPSLDKKVQLFVAPRDKTKELWDGSIIGPEAAVKRFEVDAAWPSNDEALFEKHFLDAIFQAETLYYRLGQNEVWDRKVLGLLLKAKARLGRTGRPLWPIRDPQEILGGMRLVKDKAEVERLQKAAQITAEGHCEAMQLAKAGMLESEIEAALYHAFRVRGASRLGYESIVASGANACILHYIENNRRMEEGDLLLIDAGAEFEYYTADITRVFPISGRFTPEQREVYSLVLKVQKECIQKVKPGRSIREIHEWAQNGLTEGLRSLGILKGKTPELFKKKAFLPYYPHGTGHYLGMDVHDTGPYYQENYDTPRKLTPGMVFTVEPGLYFSKTSDAPARYKGIGVRIEDDVLVTTEGCRVLTSGVPKEIEEIESLCSRKG